MAIKVKKRFIFLFFSMHATHLPHAFVRARRLLPSPAWPYCSAQCSLYLSGAALYSSLRRGMAPPFGLAWAPPPTQIRLLPPVWLLLQHPVRRAALCSSPLWRYRSAPPLIVLDLQNWCCRLEKVVWFVIRLERLVWFVVRLEKSGANYAASYTPVEQLNQSTG
jgi:hypothetical protein